MAMDQPTSGAQKLGDDLRMSFGDHIEDLRRRLVHAMLGVVVAAAVCFYFGFEIIAWLTRPFVQALDALDFPAQMYARDAALGFGVYIKVSLVAAVIVASPWVVYQVWRFIAEGLYQHERRTALLLAPFSTLMTVLAVLFTYHVLLPVSLVFFINFASLYPEVEPGRPSVMIQWLTGAEPAEEVEVDGDAGDADAADDDIPGAELPGELAGELPAELPGAELPGAGVQLPVLAADPPAPADGQVWINRQHGQMKAYFGGRIHVLSVTSSRMLAPLPDLGEYVRFASLMGLGVVIAFQLPVFMLVVGWTGLIDPDQVARFRKYALFVCFAAGALLTPTDFLSMFVLAVPLYALFEFGLVLMRLADRRRPRADDGLDDE